MPYWKPHYQYCKKKFLIIIIIIIIITIIIKPENSFPICTCTYFLQNNFTLKHFPLEQSLGNAQQEKKTEKKREREEETVKC